jgi:hypothetical protein
MRHFSELLSSLGRNALFLTFAGRCHNSTPQLCLNITPQSRDLEPQNLIRTDPWKAAILRSTCDKAGEKPTAVIRLLHIKSKIFTM